MFRTIGNDKETILELTSLAAGDKEELYSALSKVAGNEGKISDLMEKLYSQNMDKYREIVYKDGTKLQGTAEYEIAVATEVMKDALKKEKYLEDDDKFVVPGSLESIVNNLKTDKHFTFISYFLIISPFPILNFRHIFAVFFNIIIMFNYFIVAIFNGICSCISKKF